MGLNASSFRALVTGADEHQGLAVIRGLGLGGVEVIAAGAQKRCIGHRSRYATMRAHYAAPSEHPEQFVEDVLRIARATRPAVIVPSVETTLVLLNKHRELVEEIAPLAAPEPDILECALDKARTVHLARKLGVPVPRTVTGVSVADLIEHAGALRFPVAIKPRGNHLHPATINRIPFKSTYAASIGELASVLAPIGADAERILVQEFVPGTGRCVAAVCRHGEPLELFAYAREREYPLSGGVSVLRRSIPLDTRLREYTTHLLGAINWHGVAMVEFKYDAATNQYALMEINGRFQASTALSLDAGLNLPLVVASLFAGWTPPASPSTYRVGVAERWLRGDLLALRGALLDAPSRLHGPRPTRMNMVRRFLGDFRRDVHLDEFWWSDPGPALEEVRSLATMLAGWGVDAAKSLLRPLVPGVRTPATILRQAGLETPGQTR